MKVSIDISMYPLNEDYVPSIKQFISALQSHSFEVRENKMSTQVFGDYDDVMTVLQKEIKKASADPKVVFVLKVIPFDLSN